MNWYTYSLLAAVLLTTAVLLEKRGLNKIHALEFSTETSFYGLILCLFLLPWVDWHLSLETYLLMFLQGVTALFAYWLFNKSLRHSDVSQIAPLTNLDIIFTLLFSSILLSDLPGLSRLLGVLLILLGSYFLERGGMGKFNHTFRTSMGKKGFYLIIFSMLLFGLNKTLGKILLFQVTPITLLFFAYITFFVGFIALDLLLFKENVTRLKSLLKERGSGLFFTSLSLFGYRLFMTLAIASGSVTLATAISRTSTFFTAFAGGKLFAEKSLNARLIASATILIGVLFTIL